MIKHIVMYKLKNPTKENCQAMVDKFMSMQGKIDVLKSVIAGSDILKSERSFDVCLECVFENVKDMQTYQSHPVHIPVREFVGSLVEKAHSVDYEF
ncbi:MAG: Dabb family protein [Clostridia bacterium]|nr:Dabb family protein [Clostridia bacterium]